MGQFKRGELRTEQLCIDADFYKLLFFVNGERIEEQSVDPRTTLSTYLREKLRLTGTKIGCNEGGCGACTVMVSEQNPLSKQIRHYSVNACLTPLCSVFGKAVTTVEGIGNTRKLHPIQKRLARAHGTQCGFCSPGFVMAMYTLLRNNATPTEEEINEAIQGNLCRCTGYRPILEAFYSFAKKQTPNGDIEDCVVDMHCCKFKQQNGFKDDRKQLTKLSHFNEDSKYDPKQELIFPPALMANSLCDKSFCMMKDGITWFQPVSLADLLALKAHYPKAKIVCGNTELGVELKFQFIHVSTYINSKQVPDLLECFLDEEKGAFIGAAVSLSEMSKMLSLFTNRIPVNKSGVFRSVQKMLHWFAGKHVRDVASFAGNLATASPIGDLNPIWMAANASVVLVSASGEERTVSVDENFFIEYRKTIIRDDEIIKGIWIPFTERGEYFDAYKQAQRREDGIAIVNAAFSVQLEPYTYEVLNARIAYGGMAPITKFAQRTSKAIVGKKWNRHLLELAISKLGEEFVLSPGVPGGMERYRQALSQSFFLKFFMNVDKQMKVRKNVPNYENLVGENLLSFTDAQTFGDNRSKFRSTQLYPDVPSDQPLSDPVGRPILHQSAVRQLTGEALYCDDVDVLGALHLAFVLSSIACGELVGVDTSAALKVPGVVAYIDSRDVHDGFLIEGDTPVFVERKISYYGQPIGAIVAHDHETARRAAHLVKVTCRPQKAIVTMEEAENEESFLTHRLFQVHSSLLNGDTVAEFDWSNYDKVVRGSVRCGAQEHFYLETHQCLVIPGECDEISVVSSTQNVNEVQMSISEALGVPQHKVSVRVRRIGGGFGGKAHCCSLFAVPTAIAAVKLRKPVKCSMERYDDMVMSGTRHPFKCEYKIAIRSDGIFENAEWKLTSNCGHTMDMSVGVMTRAMVHADSVYRWPNADIYGRVCKTNLASNTAFRGFGAPQAMFATETMLKHVAEEYGFDVNEIREKNMYDEEGDCTPFGTHLHQCNIRRCWNECLLLSDYNKRLQAINEFNRSNEYRKRGIYIVPTKFGVGFSVRHCNQ
uniref:xanthine dehydrogenase n=1 Tax=Ascaris lumbricoides TaxID=6252 RepID=A0A9J2Q8P4_ASCLU